jgi:hypothetical protein
MASFADTNRGASFFRSTVLFLAVAGTSYVAGALVHNPASSRDISASFAPPVQAAEPRFRAPLLEDDGFAMPSAIESGRTGDEVTEPRECDLPKGISVACLFMD